MLTTKPEGGSWKGMGELDLEAGQVIKVRTCGAVRSYRVADAAPLGDGTWTYDLEPVPGEDVPE
jgi:hypothetical protein